MNCDPRFAEEPLVIRRRMSITRREFMRSLIPAIAPAKFEESIDGHLIEVIGAPGRVEIHLSDERERRLASLRLPIIDVRITLTGFEPEARKRFLSRFERAFQRGGG
ncbi:hypothetical protein [Thioalkalivibrio sp. HK1]|uniref:hypothetical protein n=1 Tax=Thioalkalivibrio sp. HK1 TaxID=1469245 RepID=UPI00046FB8D3|nr:hypothetical protein [Thioalkalivibrio sp. HK1]